MNGEFASRVPRSVSHVSAKSDGLPRPISVRVSPAVLPSTIGMSADSGGENKTVLSSQALENAFLARAAILTSRYDVVYGRPEALIPPTKMEIDVKRQDVRVMAPRWVATK